MEEEEVRTTSHRLTQRMAIIRRGRATMAVEVGAGAKHHRLRLRRRGSATTAGIQSPSMSVNSLNARTVGPTL